MGARFGVLADIAQSPGRIRGPLRIGPFREGRSWGQAICDWFRTPGAESRPKAAAPSPDRPPGWRFGRAGRYVRSARGSGWNKAPSFVGRIAIPRSGDGALCLDRECEHATYRLISSNFLEKLLRPYTPLGQIHEWFLVLLQTNYSNQTPAQFLFL